MDESNKRLLMIWHHKSKLYYDCHRDTARYYNNWDKLLGLPSIIINVFNSTSLLANYQDAQQVFLLVIAALTIVSTILNACQAYFKFSHFVNLHKKSMAAYSRILYDIEKIIILVKNDLTYKIDQNIMTNILSSLEKLREDNLEFPEKIWKKYNTEYKRKLSIDYDMTSSDTIKILAHTFKEKPEVITYSNKNTVSNSDDVTLDNLNIDSKTPPKDKIHPTPSVLYAEEPPKTVKESNQNITIDIDSKTI
jgi:hypothetical protein